VGGRPAVGDVTPDMRHCFNLLDSSPERHMFVLALSRTSGAQMTNGPYVQLSVEMCSECGALVAEDQMPLHKAFHASLRDAR